jgi:hypothetical protein
VGDTSHYHAYSNFETVKYQDDKGQEHKKSQSKVTKRCQCDDKEHCEHKWELADDGAGTIVKSSTKMYWGHKASIIGLPKQGIPLDAAAVADGSTHDSRTLLPHLERLYDNLPEVRQWTKKVLYDSACDDKQLKQTLRDLYDIELKASLNPRGRKSVKEGLPRGMDELTPYGELICHAGHTMEYLGARFDTECFVFGPPKNDFFGQALCLTCAYKPQCCPNAKLGRSPTIPFELLSHIDPNDSQLSKRFRAIMTRRPAVERMIKRLKCDLSDDRLTKRGNASFQAYLDKTLIGFHILLRQ